LKNSLYTLFYAATLGIVCAALLIGVGQLTGPYRVANEKAEQLRTVLEVLEVPFDRDLSSRALLEQYAKRLPEEKLGTLTVYRYTAPQSGEVRVAVHFEGMGLWGPIKGYLALDERMETIRGVSFYQQEETPGLGGEIASDTFRNGFRSLAAQSASGEPGIRIRRGKAEGKAANEVDGITGATLTCGKVETMLNTVLTQIMKERSEHER